ncbi:hypothetical protein [Hazenella coriacea]|uniref:Uncharacterized protein n=1 Tax=Hazenella coriacea TaxID=1179467 RepID=A0A4R3L7D3_9BACL|nr:hypothetical protein [Hazenella coriacea]TCS95008.1 hypothetical protein EDD58_103433 [Hazenella coriacea]
MIETKKGKYSDEENERIIESINEGLQEGKRERDILRELSEELKRGYAGIISHARKLRAEYPERFHMQEETGDGSRLNSWEEDEEKLVIDTVNQYLDQGKSLSAAIEELEKKLSRTQGAIYQRIYTLRRKHPEKFSQLPAQRPRRRRKLESWQIHRPIVRSLDEGTSMQSSSDVEDYHSTVEQQLASASEYLHQFNSPNARIISSSSPLNSEEGMLLKAFEERYGRLNPELKSKMVQLMRFYGCTRVSITLFTLAEDKQFPTVIIKFLENRLQSQKFL